MIPEGRESKSADLLHQLPHRPQHHAEVGFGRVALDPVLGPGFAVGEQQKTRFAHGLPDDFGDILGADPGFFHPALDARRVAVVRGAHGFGQTGLDEGRTQHRDLDSGRCQLGAQHLGKRDHAGLGRAVGNDSRRAGQTGPGGDVDDVAEALLAEASDEVMATAHHAHQVDPEHPLPVRQRGLAELAAGGDSGIVDQQVEAAVIPIDALDHRLPGGIVGHIQRQPEVAIAAQGCRNRLGPIGVLVGHQHGPAVGGEAMHHGLAEAGAGAGDQRDPGLLILHHAAP